NLFRITGVLWASAAARDQVNAVAQMYGCKDSGNCAAPDYQRVRKDIEDNLKALPVGYQKTEFVNYWKDIGNRQASDILSEWAINVGGWLLAAIAVSLGAPFWFDLLNKLINVRLAGSKPPSPKSAKKQPAPS